MGFSFKHNKESWLRGSGQTPSIPALEAYRDPSLGSLSEGGVVILSEAKDLLKPQADSIGPSLRSG